MSLLSEAAATTDYELFGPENYYLPKLRSPHPLCSAKFIDQPQDRESVLPDGVK